MKVPPVEVKLPPTVIAPALVMVATLAPVLSLLAFHRKEPSTVGRVKPNKLVEVLAPTTFCCTHWLLSASLYQMKVFPVSLSNHICPGAGLAGGVSLIAVPG